MVKVRTRPLSKVPPPPPPLPSYGRRTTSRGGEIERCLLALDTASAGEVELENGESLTTIRAQIREIATRHGLELRIWNVSQTMYFSLKPDLWLPRRRHDGKDRGAPQTNRSMICAGTISVYRAGTMAVCTGSQLLCAAAAAVNGTCSMRPPILKETMKMAATADYAQQIVLMTDKSKADSDFATLLAASLQQANDCAKSELDNGLYNALAWPSNLQEYISYLYDFARWTPEQSKAEVWKKPGADEQQEVYDRLCHFYWLINQEVGPDKATIVQKIPWFREWLVSYAHTWGSFLDSTESFSQQILDSFLEDSPEYAVRDSMIDGRPNAPSGWLTFNQFFARELNPGLRPIESPTDNTIVTSPADCTFKATYKIGPDSTIPEITLKKTHKAASVEYLLQGSEYKSAFADGTFVHYFLGPYSYHRFHTPVAGIVRECYPIQGFVYLNVKLSDGQFDAPDSSETDYEFAQARGVITVDTKYSGFGDVGIIAVIPVGMCQVSSVNMTATVGSDLLKGDEFGYFLFGGSDIIVLFQADVNPGLETGSQYRHYGTPIAKCR